MAKRPRGRLAEKCVEGLESRKDCKEAKVAKREDDDWGRKMWRWGRTSNTRDVISRSDTAVEEAEHIEETWLCVTS